MNKKIVNGVYPTMLTPFNEDNTIDFKALERLVEWYIAKGVDGLFAVCQSSAMFELSRRERKELCKTGCRYHSRPLSRNGLGSCFGYSF